MVVDSYGLPIEFQLTGGEVHGAKAMIVKLFASKSGKKVSYPIFHENSIQKRATSVEDKYNRASPFRVA